MENKDKTTIENKDKITMEKLDAVAGGCAAAIHDDSGDLTRQVYVQEREQKHQQVLKEEKDKQEFAGDISKLIKSLIP